MGDAVFADIVQAQFASFQIFGGLVFLVIGLQFVFRGPQAIKILRGDSEHLMGAIAMPVLIGPGTISASVVIGKRLPPLPACGAITLAMVVSLGLMYCLKVVHDFVRERNEEIVERYIETMGRLTAMVVGTFSVEMIMQGVRAWVAQF